MNDAALTDMTARMPATSTSEGDHLFYRHVSVKSFVFAYKCSPATNLKAALGSVISNPRLVRFPLWGVSSREAS